MKLDHVVYFTGKELNLIVEEQRSRGRHAVIGGRHEQWGTHNALCVCEKCLRGMACH